MRQLKDLEERYQDMGEKNQVLYDNWVNATKLLDKNKSDYAN